jgi:hypothetical protein
LRLRHFSKNFHATFMLPMFREADDETVFKNLVITRGRVTEPQEALVFIDWKQRSGSEQRSGSGL